MADDQADYTTIATNVILPFDPRRTKLLMGSLEYIAAEVVVAKVVRKIIRADTKGWLELAYVHALSLPFMGGTAAFFEPTENYAGKERAGTGKDITFPTQIMDGAKGIPAVLVAQYIIDSFAKGFHAPWFNMKDLLITAGTKMLTRPIVGFVYTYLPENAQENLAILDGLIERQREASSLKST